MRALLVLVLPAALAAQTPTVHGTPLQQQIRHIAGSVHGRVAVACSLPASGFAAASLVDCDLNAHSHPPMQSVFKLPLVMAMLAHVEATGSSLDAPVRFRPEDRLIPHAYSPLQDKNPEADVDVPLRELLRLAVSVSDNAAADILVRLMGGPEAVTRYVHSLGVGGFNLQDDEHALHRDPKLQYRDWFEPTAAVELLRRLNDRSPLSPERTELLRGWMQSAVTGPHRLSGDLPLGTPVRHKTGSSGEENGTAAATNDIGLIELPDGRELAIAVFITDSTDNEAARDAAIARIARAAYDAALNSPH